MSTYSITMSGPVPTDGLAARPHQQDVRNRPDGLDPRPSESSPAPPSLGRAAATTVLALVGTPASYDAVVALTQAVHHHQLAARPAGRRLGRPTPHHRGRRRPRHDRQGQPPHSPACSPGSPSPSPSRHAPGPAPSAEGSRAAGRLAWMLARTELVRTATTRAAQVATLLIGIHALTEGAAAAHLVQVLPWTVNLVSAATNPARALLFVAGTALAAAAVALAQLLRQPAGEPEDPSPAAPERRPTRRRRLARTLRLRSSPTWPSSPAPSTSKSNATAPSPSPESRPRSRPTSDRSSPRSPSTAALRQLRRTLRLRPTPNRDDRRLFTKAARDAIRAEAHRRRDAA